MTPALPVVVSTGCLPLDGILGIGGLARGRIVEFFGPDGAGKTTLALQLVTEVQRAGGVAAIVDADQKLDPEGAVAIGVDLDALLVAQPDCGEQALEIVETLVRSGAVDVIVIDSMAGLVPRATLDNGGDLHDGLQARLMSQALRKLAALTEKTGTIVVFVNPVVQKIRVSFGTWDVTTGGNALKFYATFRIEVRRVGDRTRIKVVKNKLAPPFRSVDVVMGERGFEALVGVVSEAQPG